MVTAGASVPGGPAPGPVPGGPAPGPVPVQPLGIGNQFNGGSMGIALTSKAIMLLLLDTLLCVYLFIF